MRVLYDSHDTLNLEDFGIFIPVSKDNAARTMENLLQMASSPHPPAWWIPDLPEPPSREDLLRVHTPRLVDALLNEGEAHNKEVLSTFELINPDGSYHRYDPKKATRPLHELTGILLKRGGGSIGAGLQALETGSAFYLGGGFHHAMADFGAGFCLYHDVVVAIRKLQAEGRIKNAWIVDIDAHKGDGTAALTRKDPSIVTLSIHMARGWPIDISEAEASSRPDRSKLSFEPSTLDIPVDSGEESEYCADLDAGLQSLWAARGRSIRDAKGLDQAVPHPDLVYVLAGADPFEEDELPSTQLLRLSREQMRERDQLVHGFFREKDIPIAYVSAGNYGESGWKIYTDFLAWALGY